MENSPMPFTGGSGVISIPGKLLLSILPPAWLMVACHEKKGGVLEESTNSKSRGELYTSTLDTEYFDLLKAEFQDAGGPATLAGAWLVNWKSDNQRNGSCSRKANTTDERRLLECCQSVVLFEAPLNLREQLFVACSAASIRLSSLAPRDVVALTYAPEDPDLAFLAGRRLDKAKLIRFTHERLGQLTPRDDGVDGASSLSSWGVILPATTGATAASSEALLVEYPAKVAFPATKALTGSSVAMRLTNKSSFPVSMTVRMPSGPFEAGQVPCLQRVFPGMSCDVRMTFSPRTSGSYAGDVLVGVSSPLTGQKRSFHVALEGQASGGVLDPSFGDRGISVLSQAGTSASPHLIGLLGSNRIVIAGRWRTSPAVYVNQHGYFDMFTPDGVVDRTFGNSGSVIITHMSWVSPSGIYLTDSGKINTFSSTVGGSGATASSAIQFLPNGQLDPSFGVNGFSPVMSSGNLWMDRYLRLGENLYAVIAGNRLYMLDGSGRRIQQPIYGDFIPLPWSTIGAGYVDGETIQDYGSDGFVLYGNTATSAVIAKIKASGEPMLFGQNGAVSVELGGTTYMWQGKILPDRSILISGDLTIDSVYYRVFLKTDPAGNLDYTFGDRGILKTGVNWYSGWHSSQLFHVDLAGRITFVSGFEMGGPRSYCRVARLHANGSVDESFGDKGVLTIDQPNWTGSACSTIMADPQGRLLVGGSWGTNDGSAGWGSITQVFLARIVP